MGRTSSRSDRGASHATTCACSRVNCRASRTNAEQVRSDRLLGQGAFDEIEFTALPFRRVLVLRLVALRWAGEIQPHRTPQVLRHLRGQPVHHGESRLDAQDVGVLDRQRAGFEGWVEEKVVSLVGEAVASVVRQDDDSPRPHPADPSGASFPLEELGGPTWGFMLQHGADSRVVETNIK